MKVEKLVDDLILNPWIKTVNGVIEVEVIEKKKKVPYKLDFSFGADQPDQAGIRMERVILTFSHENIIHNAIYVTAPVKKYRGDMVAGIGRLAQYLVVAAKTSSDKKFTNHWDQMRDKAIQDYYKNQGYEFPEESVEE